METIKDKRNRAVTEIFGHRIREGLTSKVAFELEPQGSGRMNHVNIWSRASTLHYWGTPFSFCFLWNYAMHSLHSCTWSPWFFMGSTWTVPARVHYSLKDENEGVAHIPWFMLYRRREPMVFSCIHLFLSHMPPLSRDSAPFRKTFLLFYTVSLAQWDLLRQSLCLRSFPWHKSGDSKGDNCWWWAASVHFVFSLSPPFPFPMLKHCWIFVCSLLPYLYPVSWF